MDGQFMESFIKIIIFLPLVLLLAYISLKFGNRRMVGMGGKRLIKIVERVPLSQKSFLCIAVIDGKPYVIGSTEERIEILKELPPESLERLSEEDNSFKSSLIGNFNLLMNRKERL